jgi:hypothetical protein
MDENEIVSKIYCCGNSVQREAKILAAFDIVSFESEKKTPTRFLHIPDTFLELVSGLGNDFILHNNFCLDRDGFLDKRKNC